MPTTTARAKEAAGLIFPTDVAKKKVITAVIIDVAATVEPSTFIGTIGTAISLHLIVIHNAGHLNKKQQGMYKAQGAGMADLKFTILRLSPYAKDR
jgi:hypothetical protein